MTARIRPSHKIKNKKGFTLAEVLITIAVISILAGFGTVTIISFQNRMRLKEADETAKAIFMAAQNQLTASWAKGILEEESREHPVASDEEVFFGYSLGGTKYLTCSYDGHRGINLHKIDNVVGELLLPFGSIDESVRSGYSYAIVYDRRKAAISQVFCCRCNRDLSEENLVLKLLADPDYLKDPKRDTEWRVQRAKEDEKDGERMYLGYYGG